MTQPFAAHVTADLDRRIAQVQTEARLPSVVARVVQGDTVWDGAAGAIGLDLEGPTPDCDTAYMIASITKTFTAVAVMQLRGQGALNLDDPLADLRDAQGATLDLPESVLRLTIRHLLTHTSGLRSEPHGPWWERSHPRSETDLRAACEAVFAPNVRFHYSNPAFALLGFVVARLRGAPWIDVVTDRILTPLGLTRTGLHPDPNHAAGLAVHPFADLLQTEPPFDGGEFAPAGRLWSTTRDLGRWGQFWAGDTGGVLDPATVTEICRPLAVVDNAGLPWTGAYGLGVEVLNLDGRRIVGHTGGLPGYIAMLRVDLGTGTVATMLTNSTGGTAIGPATLDLLTTATAAAPMKWSPASASYEPFAPADLGQWFWGSMAYVFSFVGEHVVLTPMGTGRGARFARGGDGVWRGLDGYFAGEELRRREDDGNVWLDVATFCFSRMPYANAPIPGGVGEWRALPGVRLTPPDRLYQPNG